MNYAVLDKGESLAQNVDRLLFGEDGELRNEFHNLYHALFRNSEKYIAIVEVLAQKKKGITRNTLIKELSVESSGGVSKALDDLENCGFIRRFNLSISTRFSISGSSRNGRRAAATNGCKSRESLNTTVGAATHSKCCAFSIIRKS